MKHEPTVHVVDDDDAVRKAMCMLFRSDGLRTADYAAPDEFLEAVSEQMTGCIVLDIRMPGMDGLDLQQRLQERDISMPVIFLTGHADVPKAVRAMKQGALDFIEKPFDDEHLLSRVQYAMTKGALQRHRKNERDRVAERIEQGRDAERD